MSLDFNLILEECLVRLRAGDSLEDCLSSYPPYADTLRPLLQAAIHIRSIPPIQARSAAIETGRARFLAAAAASIPVQNTSGSPVSKGRIPRYLERIITILQTLLIGKEKHGMKLALRLAIDLIVIMLIGSVLTVNASASSLPGDTLYGVKRTWEDARLALTLDLQVRQTLQEQLTQERLQEVQKLIELHRPAIIEFEGNLDVMGVNAWIVGGLDIQLKPDTIVEGTPAEGLAIWVRAQVQNDGTLTALQVRVVTQTQLTPGPNQSTEPSHTPMHTPEPSRTPEPTYEPTHMPQPTHEPTHMPEPTHEPTHMPQPTHEPNHMPEPTHESMPTHEPMPTHHPEPAHDGHH